MLRDLTPTREGTWTVVSRSRKTTSHRAFSNEDICRVVGNEIGRNCGLGVRFAAVADNVGYSGAGTHKAEELLTGVESVVRNSVFGPP